MSEPSGFRSRVLLLHHRRYAVLGSETTPCPEISFFHGYPNDPACFVAAEIRHPPARQRQTKERRAGSADANEQEPSQSSGEAALQRNFPASSSRQISQLQMDFYFSYRSCAITSGGSTRVAQPTIMLRKVSHPSAKTRITCGTRKRM